MIFNINVSNGRISKLKLKYKRRTTQIQFFKYSWVGLDLINRDTVVWSPNNDSVITAKSTVTCFWSQQRTATDSTELKGKSGSLFSF